MVFRDLIRYRVERSALPLALRYIPATDHEFVEIFKSGSGRSQEGADVMTLKVTSPLFYAKLARSASLTDAVLHMAPFSTTKTSRLPAQTDGKTLTPNAALFYTSHPQTIFDLLSAVPTEIHRTAPNQTFFSLSLRTRLHWMPIKVLRNLASKTFIMYDHQAVLSDLDWHAIMTSDTAKSHAYRRATIKLLVSDYMTFGVPGVIDACIWILDTYLIWMWAGAIQEMIDWSQKISEASVLNICILIAKFSALYLWTALGRVI